MSPNMNNSALGMAMVM